MPVDKISIITPTGDRPAGFAWVERWMARQTYTGEIQWIVVDDGRVPTEVTAGQRYVRRDRAGDRVRQTLCLNLRAALPLVRYDRLIIVEDDDWYPASYLADMAELLDSPYDIVGVGETKKYHLAFKRWFIDPNTGHAGLFTTGLNPDGIEALRELVAAQEENDFLDLDLWEAPVRRRLVTIDPRPVAIKGMRERDGISIGHDYCSWFADDPDGEVYRQWLGADAHAYEPWLGAEAAEPTGEATMDDILSPMVKYGNVVRRTMRLELRVEAPAGAGQAKLPRVLVRPVLAAIQEFAFAASATGGGALVMRVTSSGEALAMSVDADVDGFDAGASARLPHWLTEVTQAGARAGTPARAELGTAPPRLAITVGAA